MALQQTEREDSTGSPRLSHLIGPTEPPLWDLTLSDLLKKQASTHPTKQCVVFSAVGHRATYAQLYHRTLEVAKGLLAAGVQDGDHIGVMAGNCPPYVELLFAASHVGAALVVLNSTYTSSELRSALEHSECKILFSSPSIGTNSNMKVLDMLSNRRINRLKGLREVIILGSTPAHNFRMYGEFIEAGRGVKDDFLQARMGSITANNVCNLQFTSGTTGRPKAAMLTHRNIINNGRFIGDRMRLTTNDIICCPPPLFHCFGLVLGLLAVITHGSSIVFPSETFQATKVLDAIIKERCTGLHGVPAMFSAELELRQSGMNFSTLRTGIAAGASVPMKLMEDLRGEFNMTEITNTYGMTETSPASFMTFTDDPIDKRLSTVGKILPHTQAKIINANGDILPIGARGELCIAGFSLQKGYWKNPEKTAEVMLTDKDGVRWMHTGDEAVFDTEGYCRITGRIKDIIIRGGENIFPLEIEERLVQHPSVVQASVVGLPDDRYGEVVSAFLQAREGHMLPSLEEVREFVWQSLARHKAPAHVFWLAFGEEFPKTGSGKIQKYVLKEQGKQTLEKNMLRSKL